MLKIEGAWCVWCEVWSKQISDTCDDGDVTVGVVMVSIVWWWKSSLESHPQLHAPSLSLYNKHHHTTLIIHHTTLIIQHAPSHHSHYTTGIIIITTLLYNQHLILHHTSHHTMHPQSLTSRSHSTSHHHWHPSHHPSHILILHHTTLILHTSLSFYITPPSLSYQAAGCSSQPLHIISVCMRCCHWCAMDVCVCVWEVTRMP